MPNTNSQPELNFESIGIGDSHPCFIIAEIGQNHQGNLENAKDLIRKAKSCGVDCVKFQKSSLPDRFTKETLTAPYESPNSFGPTYGEHRAHLEFSEDEFRELKQYAEQVGIFFAASAMDIPSADFLMKMNVPFIKVGSGDTNNFLLLEYAAKTKYPVILSTGMQSFETVKKAHEIFHKHNSEIVILHCVSAYPTDFQDVNLRILDLYKLEFKDAIIGYSGHEIGTNVALAAVALGAKVIEKHFTLDKSQKGTDHQCSLDPSDMKLLVNGIREVEKALGNPVKRILASEEPCRLKLGKSIVAAQKMTPGKILELSDLAVKVSRPMGIPPEEILGLVGKTVASAIGSDEPMSLNDTGQVISAMRNPSSLI